MKKLFAAGLVLANLSAFGQASVAYYPFRSVLSVSSNANRVLWIDARLQTNTLTSALSTTVAPMINFIRKPTVNYYAGLGVQFNALNNLNDAAIIEGYSLHVGVRVAPFPAVPNVRVAFEISPSARPNFKSGVLYSYLGIAYQFKKRAER